MPLTADYYEVLGVKRSADVRAIRAAYRRAAKTAHPDRGGSNEAFRLVQEAADALLAEAETRAVSAREGAYREGDRTSADGEWTEVADALRLKWALAFDPVFLFAPQKIGLSPFASATTLNAPAYQWLTRNVGPRGEAWDFHIADGQTRIFFRRPDDTRLFKLKYV